MPRHCFTLQVRPDRLAEYAERHAAVWPEMCQALHDTGWRDYSLFLREDGLLVGYVVADDLTAAQAAMAATEVNARWQAEMADFFVGTDGRPIRTGQAAAMGAGDYLTLTADGTQESRSPRMDVIVVGGQPIREPLAWAGPFVMNTKAEVLEAYQDFQRGSFGQIPG